MIFDVFDEWFAATTSKAARSSMSCSSWALATPSARPAQHLENIRSFLGDLAPAAGVADPDSFARTWHILMKRLHRRSDEGHTEAAQRVKSVAQLVVAQHS